MAPAGLGPGMASFYYESNEQEHQKWPRPAWGRISPFWYYGVHSEVAPAGLGPDLVILSLRGLLAGAPKVAPAGLGPDLVILLLRGSLTGAPEVAPAGLGLDLGILLLRGLLAGAPEVGI